MEDFEGNHSVVGNKTIRNEGTLGGRDDIVKVIFYSISNDFCDNTKNNIIEVDRTKILRALWGFKLRDKHDKSMV